MLYTFLPKKVSMLHKLPSTQIMAKSPEICASNESYTSLNNEQRNLFHEFYLIYIYIYLQLSILTYLYIYNKHTKLMDCFNTLIVIS